MCSSSPGKLTYLSAFLIYSIISSVYCLWVLFVCTVCLFVCLFDFQYAFHLFYALGVCDSIVMSQLMFFAIVCVFVQCQAIQKATNCQHSNSFNIDIARLSECLSLILFYTRISLHLSRQINSLVWFIFNIPVHLSTGHPQLRFSPLLCMAPKS